MPAIGQLAGKSKEPEKKKKMTFGEVMQLASKRAFRGARRRLHRRRRAGACFSFVARRASHDGAREKRPQSRFR